MTEMMMVNELSDTYVICVNVRGEDYQIEAKDRETALLLLNDYEAACNYVEHQQNEILNSYSAGNSKLDHQNESLKNNVAENSNKPGTSLGTSSDGEPVWTRRKPTERDNEATSLLLTLREKNNSKFDDKKTAKSKVWYEIAQAMIAQGFNLGENGPEKCRQKFANLTKTYMAYIKHQKRTGSDAEEEEPPFFLEMHSILGYKDKTYPRHLEDSFTKKTNVMDTEDCVQEDSQSSDSNTKVETEKNKSQDRFKNVRKVVRPASKMEEIVKEFKDERVSRETHFNFLKSHLQKSEEQRERFLNILENAFSEKSTRKRKQSSDSE